MKTEQFIIIYGNPIDGLSHVGPFYSRDDAIEYAISEPYNGNWWISMLEAPAYATDETRSNGPHQTTGA
jgi:hypothetical protein